MTPTFEYLLKGFSMLTHKGLKRYVFIPLIINCLFFIFLFWVAHHYFEHLMNWLHQITPHWLSWLDWLMWPAFFITFSIVALYSFTIVANLICAPFNSFLSEKVELLITGAKPSANEGLLPALFDVIRSFKREVLKIRYYLPRLAFLLLLFVVPGVNIIAPIAWFIFGCWMMALEYIDYPMDNHRTPLYDVYKIMRRKPIKYFLFGFTITIGLLIPFVNLFVMPAAVIGASLMWIDERRR